MQIIDTTLLMITIAIIPFSEHFKSALNISNDEFDKITRKEIILNHKIHLGVLKDSIFQEFGKPEKISDEMNEFNGVPFVVMHYKNFKLTMINDSLTGFEIRTKNITVFKNAIKVGDREEILKERFSISYRTAFQHYSEKIIRVQIDEDPDYILFIVNRGVISEIMTWESW